MILWVPVEKLFMSEIGFTPASVGVMAAAYAVVVPLLEVPSGVLADRWSRSRIMVLACVALLVSSTIGGLSQSVATYVVAAVALGGYFALSSGTVDSIVYDTVLEETGSSELYETWIGRVRITGSSAAREIATWHRAVSTAQEEGGHTFRPARCEVQPQGCRTGHGCGSCRLSR